MLPLFLIVFIDLMGFGIIIPLLPFYAEHFHADPFTVGLVMATYSLTQLIAAPVWGRMSDRIGRRPVLLITLAGTAASYIWLGFVDSLAALFAARAIGGPWQAISPPPSLTWLTSRQGKIVLREWG